MTYSDLRSRARESLSGKWAQAIAISLVASLLGGLLLGSSFIPQISYTFRGEHMELEDVIDALVTVSSRVGSSGISLNALMLVQSILGGVIQLGYADILLKQHDRREYEFRDLFSQFHRFGQGFAQQFLRGLYIFLWSLLLIIPGIVKSYSYAMTPFILAEHPELTVNEAIQQSEEMMDGHKGELFMLYLTFIGWDLLAALTLNLGHILLNPYKNAAAAAFYREISGYPRMTVE